MRACSQCMQTDEYVYKFEKQSFEREMQLVLKSPDHVFQYLSVLYESARMCVKLYVLTGFTLSVRATLPRFPSSDFSFLRIILLLLLPSFSLSLSSSFFLFSFSSSSDFDLFSKPSKSYFIYRVFRFFPLYIRTIGLEKCYWTKARSSFVSVSVWRGRMQINRNISSASHGNYYPFAWRLLRRVANLFAGR